MDVVNEGNRVFENKDEGKKKILEGCLRELRKKKFKKREKIE